MGGRSGGRRGGLFSGWAGLPPECYGYIERKNPPFCRMFTKTFSIVCKVVQKWRGEIIEFFKIDKKHLNNLSGYVIINCIINQR